MPKGKLKAKGAATQGTLVEEPARTGHQFLCTDEPSATPIKVFFSLLKAGKLKASWKKAKGKLKASERQAKNKLK